MKVKCKGKLEFTLNAYKGSKNGEREHLSYQTQYSEFSALVPVRTAVSVFLYGYVSMNS